MSTETDISAPEGEQSAPDSAADAAPSASSPDRSSKDAEGASGAQKTGRTVELKTLAVAVLIVALVAGLAVTAWMLNGKSDQVESMESRSANNTRAEQLALNYAVGAAQMDFKDLASWRVRLTKGTSPDLTNRLNKAAESMEQIITPLQWTSSATPIVAKVRSVSDGKYVVDSFVNVSTKNSQTPDGIDSTATYSMTLDSQNNWTITDVGGTGAALQGK